MRISDWISDVCSSDLLRSGRLVVEARVSLRAALELVEEVADDLAERHVVAQLDAVLGEVVHAQEGSTARLAQLHDRADVILGEQDADLDDGLGHRGDAAIRVRSEEHTSELQSL